MKQKIISAILVLALCFSLAVCVSAETTTDFVIDEVGYLTADELSELNEYAAKLYKTCGVGIFFLYTTAETLSEYDVDSLTAGLENYVVMLENETSWFTFYGGLGENIDLDTEEALRAVYDEAETYFGGVEDFLYATSLLFAAEPDTAENCLVYDDAGLLTAAELATLEQLLDTLGQTYQAQLVICTIESMDGGDIDEFLNTLYDSMGFGYGTNHDGVLLLVCMEPREYRILSNGFAGVAIDSVAIDAIGETIVSDLSDGNYAAAFGKFADRCAYYLDGHLNGFPFDYAQNLLIALAIGILLGVVVANILKGQLKTVRQQNQANVYIKPGSLQLSAYHDRFLYRRVTQKRKESESSSRSESSRSTGGGSF